MNIFCSDSNKSVFKFSDEDVVSGFKKIGDYDGAVDSTIPDEVISQMAEFNPGIIQRAVRVTDSGEYAHDGTIIGYSYMVIENAS